MNADRDPLEALLASISDGTATDWEAVRRGADAAVLARLESLSEVSRIANFNRGMQQAGEDAPMPERWGELLLLERLGSGTRAEVYRAWDPGLQREVALKLMRRGESDDAALLAEGRIAARIRHAHVVTVLGIDRRDGRVGLWMELVRGSTLEQSVRAQGPLDAAQARRVGIEIGSALAAVHAAGILHGDIKPANVVRDAEGRYVLADFGLGRRGHEPEAGGPRLSGTPMYMAPELFAGAPATERSDLYALGLLLWFALAGRHPFEVTTMPELVPAARLGPRPALREVEPGVPASLAPVVERAIEPDPARRFAGAQAFVEALEAWRPEPAVAGRSRRRSVAALVAVALLAGAAAFTWRVMRPSPAAPPVTPPPASASPAAYAVEASFLRRDHERPQRLVSGDRVRPGDRLSLEFRATRPAWVYVLNEDERGERYLLFPQARFEIRNPLAADSTFVLPGPIGGSENGWTVTSSGVREHFLIVASPAPLPEIEAELTRLPAPRPGRGIEYAPVGDAAVERLRGVGGVAPLPAATGAATAPSPGFDRFRALAGRETDVRGVWVRQVILENPR